MICPSFNGAGIQERLRGQCCLRVYRVVVVKMSGRTAVTRKLDWGWGSVSTARSHGGIVGAGCWREATVPSLMDLSSGLLEYLYTITVELLYSSSIQGRGRWKPECIYNLDSEVRHHLFHGSLLVIEAKCDLIWETTQDYEYQQSETIGSCLGGWLPPMYHVPCLKHGKIK